MMLLRRMRPRSSWTGRAVLIFVSFVALGVIAVNAASWGLAIKPRSIAVAQRAAPTHDTAAPETDYFPSRFKAPEGEVSEPIATF